MPKFKAEIAGGNITNYFANISGDNFMLESCTGTREYLTQKIIQLSHTCDNIDSEVHNGMFINISYAKAVIDITECTYVYLTLWEILNKRGENYFKITYQ